MNQQINLFHPIFRRQEKKFSAKTMLQAAAAIALGVLVLLGINWWQLQSLSAQLAQADEDFARANAQVQQLSKLPKREADPVLQAELSRLENTYRASQLVSVALRQGKGGQGYSEYFMGLGRQHLPGLWLTTIAIADNGNDLVLQGRTPAPDSVPRYLQRLANEPAFAGKQFDAFEIARPVETTKTGEVAAPYVEFTIRTRHVAVPKP